MGKRQFHKEQLRAFIAKVKNDASLQQQLQQQGSDPVRIAKAAGFTFTFEESCWLKRPRNMLNGVSAGQAWE